MKMNTKIKHNGILIIEKITTKNNPETKSLDIIIEYNINGSKNKKTTSICPFFLKKEIDEYVKPGKEKDYVNLEIKNEIFRYIKMSPDIDILNINLLLYNYEWIAKDFEYPQYIIN